MAGRNSVLRGDIIELTAVFLDAAGDPADPADLVFSIYPPGSNPELGAPTGDAWVYNVTLSNGGSGPEADPSKTLEKTADGHYKYAFTVPADADLGTGFDRWEATLDLEDLDETFNFVIVGGGSVGTTKLYENNMVMIRLGETIADTEGNALGEEATYYFTTTYDPLYSSIRRIRLDLGPLIANVPNDTINLAIFEASLHVDKISFAPIFSDGAAYLAHAKRELATCYAELILITGSQGLGSDKMNKTLGDLTVGRGGGDISASNREDKLRECIAQWEPVVQSGGEISPATSLKPVSAVKGSTAEDRVGVGREWEPTSVPGSGMPLSNRHEQATARRWVRNYRKRT